MENWRAIPDWEGLYEISDLGRVRSVRRIVKCRFDKTAVKKGKVLAPTPGRGDYLSVGLWHAATGRMKRMQVHRLVLLTFIGPAPEGTESRHEDGTRRNNTLGNLSWAPHVDNIGDKLMHGTLVRGEKHHKAKITAEDVHLIRTSGLSPKTLARRFQMQAGAIRNIRARRTWKHVA